MVRSHRDYNESVAESEFHYVDAYAEGEREEFVLDGLPVFIDTFVVTPLVTHLFVRSQAPSGSS
jgi:hypothetical protein